MSTFNMTKTTNSSQCFLFVLAILLGASLLGTCTANKDPNSMDPIKNRKWGWGWGWGWGRGGGEGQGQGSGAPRGQGGWPGAPGFNFSGGGGGDCPFSHKNRTHSHGLNKIVVGGSANWNFGFNYTDWALRNGPFYINDVLVFKYPAPVKGGLPGHSVYLLPDFSSYLNCDLSRAKRLATPTQGGGKGFEFKLTKWQPHYFACGEHGGIHCNLGMMKFFVMPIFRYDN